MNQERIVYQSSTSVEPAYSTAGTIEGWLCGVATPGIGNSRLAFALAGAFAGPLLRLAGEDCGGFHVVGASSEGKTTVILASASVWGNPTLFVRTWRATANGLESIAALHNDGTLFLDELGQVESHEAGKAAYLLSAGQGKARANRAGAARPAARWLLLFFSTGEISLSARMAEASQRAHAGQLVRMVDIPIDAGANMGAFESLHGIASPAEFADAVKTAASSHHGEVGLAFLRRLVADRARIAERIGDDLKAIVVELAPTDASGQVVRVARRFALVAYAGELATRYGLTGWPKGEATRAAKKCFSAWLAGFGGADGGQREDRAIISQVKAFLELHGSSRFEPIDGAGDRPTFNRAGFYRSVGETKSCKFDPSSKVPDNSKPQCREFLVLPEAFRNEVCKGLEHRHAARVLRDKEILAPGDGKHLTQNQRLPGIGVTRVFVITPKLWEVET